MIIDFHTHAFPDALAERAMRTLLAEIHEETVRAYHDGRVSSLLASMDRAGIERSVLCSIATKPDQFDKILAWSRSIASPRIIPFPSVHPRDPDALERISRLAAEGFRGIKLHPYYQDFVIDEEILMPLYERLLEKELIVVCHTGFDIAFPRVRRCDPEKIAKIHTRFPELKFVTTHLGSWSDWDEVEKHLIGRPVYMEISYTLGQIPDARVRDLILRHPKDRVLFGTDSPWQDQKETLDRLQSLNLGESRERAILGETAQRLLTAK